jgi:hypothetical protein
MSLDFNTLEPQKQNSAETIAAPSGPGISSEPGTSMSGPSSAISRFQTHLLMLALFFSVLALVGVLYTLSHLPETEPVSIRCDPDLLKKIEDQAKILEEIAKKSKPEN